MAIINKGTAFSNGEQLTADKINNLLDLATFDQSATDSASTTVNSASQIVVADSGITTAKLATDAVTTAKLATDAVETAKIKDANVTKAKIEDVADYKVLGNVSGAAAAPAEVAILDEDDMVSNSDTALATQQSIKAYVDASAPTFVPASYAGEESVTLPNGLIMKMGSTTSKTVNYGTAFPGGCVSVTIAHRNPYSDTYGNASFVDSSSLSGFTISSGRTVSGSGSWFWQAIGY
jgi:hypothetical protein